jgi:trigger factor
VLVDTEVTESGRYERTLTVRLEEAELEAAKSRAARKLAGELKIKGFRPGKAPRSIVERMVGEDTLRSEAIEEAIPGVVGDALDESDLEPVTVPRVSDIRDAGDGIVEVDVVITLWPTLDAVPDFSGREIEIDVPGIDETEVEQQFDALRNQSASLEGVDRPATEGDFVMVNITVLRSGSEIEEASASDLLYEVGSRSFIPGLDDLLAGAEAGTIAEGQGTLPQGFTEHAGEEVTLRVLVKEVRAKVLPELTDELVADVTEFETVAEAREQVERNLLVFKIREARAQFQDRLVSALLEELDMELPGGLVDAEVEARVRNLLSRLEKDDIDFADYLRITGQDQEAFLATTREQAEIALSTRILLEAVTAIERIEVADEDVEEAVEAIAASSGTDAAEVLAALQQGGQEEALSSDILRGKALERLVEAATPVDSDGNPVDLTIIQVEDEPEETDTNMEETAGQDEPSAGEDPAPQTEE